MKLMTSLALAVLVALCSTETLDLGDLEQYHAKQDIGAPKLTGNAIWISAQDGDGYDIAISLDTQS
ncbi:hypothetical protein TOPH_08078 [Tolypocladium ophioglossoides CBS 100239]|uniref:Uncharacterized protein n=1 Tax=Tolypocladium ophioglossoides (strain CBS 100239) TaxID=1163406 RepID=A0A0L0MZQ8_TOLOC|nr:hypothetical protein TOPH_08078 [Tolypocladium ophioglossoides CBS 100239]